MYFLDNKDPKLYSQRKKNCKRHHFIGMTCPNFISFSLQSMHNIDKNPTLKDTYWSVHLHLTSPAIMPICLSPNCNQI